MTKLQQLFEVCMKKLTNKDKAKALSSNSEEKPAIELRIDEKGFIYSKHRKSQKLPIDDEEYAQFCQMIGCIALMEMKDSRRILH